MWLTLPSFVRRALVRHEMTHVATHDFARSSRHAAYVEGVAQWEGDHEIVAPGTHYINAAASVDAVQSDRIDLSGFLFGEGDFADIGSEHGYRLGMLTVDYMEHEFGHRRTVRFYRLLANRTSARDAVEQAFGTSPRTFEAGVRSWIGSHRSWFG